MYLLSPNSAKLPWYPCHNRSATWNHWNFRTVDVASGWLIVNLGTVTLYNSTLANCCSIQLWSLYEVVLWLLDCQNNCSMWTAYLFLFLKKIGTLDDSVECCKYSNLKYNLKIKWDSPVSWSSTVILSSISHWQIMWGSINWACVNSVFKDLDVCAVKK